MKESDFLLYDLILCLHFANEHPDTGRAGDLPKAFSQLVAVLGLGSRPLEVRDFSSPSQHLVESFLGGQGNSFSRGQ